MRRKINYDSVKVTWSSDPLPRKSTVPGGEGGRWSDLIAEAISNPGRWLVLEGFENGQHANSVRNNIKSYRLFKGTAGLEVYTRRGKVYVGMYAPKS